MIMCVKCLVLFWYKSEYFNICYLCNIRWLLAGDCGYYCSVDFFTVEFWVCAAIWCWVSAWLEVQHEICGNIMFCDESSLPTHSYHFTLSVALKTTLLKFNFGKQPATPHTIDGFLEVCDNGSFIVPIFCRKLSISYAQAYFMHTVFQDLALLPA